MKNMKIRMGKSVVDINISVALLLAIITAVFIFYPSTARAAAGNLTGACTEVQTFFSGIKTILTALSVGVVTIALMIAGYQIAFAHKRVSDVAPIIIGGLLIGGAAQLATWIAPDGGCSSGTTTTQLTTWIALASDYFVV